MKTFHQLLAAYDYAYPKELIAQEPARPRDNARLLIYNRKTKQSAFDTFSNLAHYLPANAVLVLNQTKVIPARLTVTKPTGGKATLLYISHDQKGITVLSDRKLAMRSILRLHKDHAFKVADQDESRYLLKPSFPVSTIYSVLETFGTTPIPPYIKHSSLTESKLRNEYQTVFAKTKGSVAAPTASLHLTKRLLNKVKKQGIHIEYITLHVNLGTFATLTEENMKSGSLHKEYYEISPAAARRLNKAKQHNRPIIAVGTTVVRTLESAAKHPNLSSQPDQPSEQAKKTHTMRHARIIESTDKTRDDNDGLLTNLSGTTDLFIRPPYRFRFVDGIITNVHVPRSSLMMLVAAFTGRKKLLELYQLAIHHRFRLFSFGDGMMIL